jgi:hypothetical protein
LYHQEIVSYKLLFLLALRKTKNGKKHAKTSKDYCAASSHWPLTDISNASSTSGKYHKKLNSFNFSKKPRNGDVRAIFS